MVAFDALRADEARLWRLIEERAQPDANVALIDRRIWDLFGSTSAVVFTDLCGFSRGSAELGIGHFLQVIHEHKKLLFPIVDREGGVAVKIIGDSLLITFRRVDSALRAMIAAQRACQAYSRHRVENERIHLSVGIGFGPILRVGDTEVFGEEVNAASKLGEDIATAGEILLTEGAREALGAMPDVEFEPIDVTLPSSQRNYRVRYEPTPAP